MKKLILKIKDPVSCLTHMIGAVLSVIGLIGLLSIAIHKGTLWHIVGFSIFGISLILLYTASTVYHMLDISKKVNLILRKIDHMMIFVLIAGTYTPVCLTSFRGRFGFTILASVWGVGILGILLKIFWMRLPRWISTGLYLIMGWIVIVALKPLAQSMPTKAFLWMCIGGALYTVGAMIYGFERPRLPWKHFGSHEIFHLFVMAGSFSHYLMVCFIV